MPFWWLLSGLPRAFQRAVHLPKQHDDQKLSEAISGPSWAPTRSLQQ
jgi:hypothetical protein